MAIALPVLVGMTGFAIDMGRLYTSQTQLQAAVDSAALAGSLYLIDDPNVKNGDVANSVNDYLSRNYPGAYVTDLRPGSEVRSVCLTAQADVPMTFMRVLAVKPQAVGASACAGFNDLEITFILDNSGSMYGSPIAAVKLAAKNLVDAMIPDGAAPSIKVGLVPFRGKVRLPEAVDGKSAGCRNVDGSVNNSSINPPDDSCKDASLPPIFGLSYSKAAIKNAINTMNAGNGTPHTSGTVIPEGIKWGRHVLTPEEPFTEGDSTGRFRKVIILLTDGANNDGGASSRKDLSHTSRRNAYFQAGITTCDDRSYGCLDQALLSEAQIAKDNGIEIFTIRYGSSDATDVDLMKTIASSKQGTNDHYFDAPTYADIEVIFKRIGRQLGFRLL